MKSIVVLALALHLAGYGSATECYACSPTKDNDYCLTVSATTPIVDAKNSLGCLKITGDVQVGDKSETVNILSSAANNYNSIDCDAVLEGSENRLGIKNAKCISCNSNLCNSGPGLQATFVTVLLTVLCFFYSS